MPDNDADLTAEQKLLHAIFGPCDGAQRQANKTDDVLDRIKAQLRHNRTGMPPFRNRVEACGIIRACFDRMWQLVMHDVDHFFDPVNFESRFCNEVVHDYAFDLATAVCRMLVDLDFTEPTESVNQKTVGAADLRHR